MGERLAGTVDDVNPIYFPEQVVTHRPGVDGPVIIEHRYDQLTPSTVVADDLTD
jgi:hypothetical protein